VTGQLTRPAAPPVDPCVARFFTGLPVGVAVHSRLVELLRPMPDVRFRVSRSQIAFRRDRGFAWLWRPGQYLERPGAEVVLSIALGREDRSPRWKQVVNPTATQWMHHLEVHSVDDVDDEVVDWLTEAAARAGRPGSPPGGQPAGREERP
jgi:Domain of unknown function (DUF5655)